MALKHRLSSFFWAFFALGILLQLSTSKEFPLSSALICTGSIVLTLWLYVQATAAGPVRRFMARLNPVLLAGFMLISCLLLTVMLAAQSYVIVKLTMPAEADEIFNSAQSIFFGLFMISGFIAGSNYLLDKYKESLTKERELEILKRKSLEMEIELLRNQLSPHFTFNVLNNLQFLIRKDQNEALKLLSTYSKILRYYIYESQKESIDFNQEVFFLKQYFDLEINRHVAELQINSEWQLVDNSFQITPFILSTFVENAFKHVLPNQAGQYFIEHTCALTEQGTLRFEITNSFDEAVRAGRPQGIGLKHVRERLHLAYPQRHQLQLAEIGGSFHVELELNLRNAVPNH